MSTIIDDFSPIHCGDTGATFAPTFAHLDGTPVSLVAATISVVMVNVTDPEVMQTWTPSAWVIDDATNGKAHYNYQAADVAVVGSWDLYIAIIVGGRPTHTDKKSLEILYAPPIA